jgi:hypothetical protein
MRPKEEQGDVMAVYMVERDLKGIPMDQAGHLKGRRFVPAAGKAPARRK